MLCFPNIVAMVLSFAFSRELLLTPRAEADKQADESRGRGRGRRGKGKKPGRKHDRVTESNEEASAVDCEIVEPAPNRAPPKRATYATPTSSAYVARVSAIDEEQRHVAEERDLRARQAQAKTYVQVFTLRWWKEVRRSLDILDPAHTHLWLTRRMAESRM